MNKQRGFTILEILLIVFLLIFVGSAGAYVYQKKVNDKSESTVLTPQDNKASDSTGNFTYSYPENWVSVPYEWDYCCGDLTEEQPDWNVQSKPITLQPSDNQNVVVTINHTEYSEDWWSSFAELEASVKEDYFANILYDGEVNGHKVLFTRVDYLGPPDAKVESFTDHRYYYDNGDKYIAIEFRENYHHDWYPENELDYSMYLSNFEKIANSIIFSENN